MRSTSIKLCLTVLPALAILAGCQKETCPVEEMDQEQQAEEVAAPKYLVSATLTSTVDVDVALDEAGQKLSNIVPDGYYRNLWQPKTLTNLLTNPFTGNKWQVVTYSYIYKTIDTRNQSINLSSTVSYLKDSLGYFPPRVKTISVFHKQFSPDEELGNIFKSVVIPARAIHGALVVFPDYQGAGYTNINAFVPVSESYTKARQAIDAELAAIELISKLGVAEFDEDYFTENMGLSNGGSVAVAMQKILESDATDQEIKDAIKLRATYSAEGCYDYSDLIVPLVEDNSTQGNNMFGITATIKPFILISFINSICSSYEEKFAGQGIKFEDYFCEGVNNLRIEDEFGGTYTVKQYLNDGKFDIFSTFFQDNGFLSPKSMMNPDFYKEDGSIDTQNPYVKLLIECCGRSEVISGWTPKSRLFITHSTRDDLIPIDHVVNAVDALSNGGTNRNVLCEYKKLSEHTLSSMYFLLRDIVLEKHPCPLY